MHDPKRNDESNENANEAEQLDQSIRKDDGPKSTNEPQKERAPQEETPVPLPVALEQMLFETLRGAAWIFQNEPQGRFQGSILACSAVAWFIRQKGGGAELEGPFLQIAGAFEELEKGGKPRLFAKKGTPAKERERSPDRKHIQMLGAVALEVLVKLGHELDPSASKVARHLNRWPGMDAVDVHGTTVIAWRKQYRRKPEFTSIVNAVLTAPNPQAEIDRLLKGGPPGQFR